MDQALLVFTNVPDLASAQSLARTLVEARSAACVNLVPAIHSVYRWQGQIEEATKVSLLIKTTQRHYEELQRAMVSLHSYDIPEIIAVPVVAGYEPYLQWIAAETSKDTHA